MGRTPPACQALACHREAQGARTCRCPSLYPDGPQGPPHWNQRPAPSPGIEPAPVPPASDLSLPGHPKCLPSASSLASCRRQKDLLQWNILQPAVTLRVRPDARDSRCLPGVWALRDARGTGSSAPLRVRRAKNAGSSSRAAARTPTPGAAPRAPRPQLCLWHRPMAAPREQAPPSRGICPQGLASPRWSWKEA